MSKDLINEVEKIPSNEVLQRESIDCPRLNISIGDVQIRALLDTGSQITGISETLYNRLKQTQEIPTLPVQNMKVFADPSFTNH